MMPVLHDDLLDKAANTSLLFLLGQGADGPPLFLLSGGPGIPTTLTPLASRLRNPKPIFGIDYCRPDASGHLPPSIEIMAQACCSAMQRYQARGPYYVVGYSFGGLVAHEAARLLRKSGEEVALLGLIDTYLDTRVWPFRLFLRAQMRRIAMRVPLNRILRTLLGRAYGFVVGIGLQIAVFLKVSNLISHDRETHNKKLMKNHRPKYYPGKVVCFDAESYEGYGCSPHELWRAFARDIECWSIVGEHRTILRDDASLNALSAALDSKFVSEDLSRRGGASAKS